MRQAMAYDETEAAMAAAAAAASEQQAHQKQQQERRGSVDSTGRPRVKRLSLQGVAADLQAAVASDARAAAEATAIAAEAATAAAGAAAAAAEEGGDGRPRVRSGSVDLGAATSLITLKSLMDRQLQEEARKARFTESPHLRSLIDAGVLDAIGVIATNARSMQKLLIVTADATQAAVAAAGGGGAVAVLQPGGARRKAQPARVRRTTRDLQVRVLLTKGS